MKAKFNLFVFFSCLFFLGVQGQNFALGSGNILATGCFLVVSGLEAIIFLARNA